MDVRVGLSRNLNAEELMLLNCGVGEECFPGGPDSKISIVCSMILKDVCSLEEKP